LVDYHIVYKYVTGVKVLSRRRYTRDDGYTSSINYKEFKG